MTYKLTEDDWIELAKEFRRDDRSLQEQFDACRDDIAHLCESRDTTSAILLTIEKELAIEVMKLALLGGVMVELHKADKS